MRRGLYARDHYWLIAYYQWDVIITRVCVRFKILVVAHLASIRRLVFPRTFRMKRAFYSELHYFPECVLARFHFIAFYFNLLCLWVTIAGRISENDQIPILIIIGMINLEARRKVSFELRCRIHYVHHGCLILELLLSCGGAGWCKFRWPFLCNRMCLRTFRVIRRELVVR